MPNPDPGKDQDDEQEDELDRLAIEAIVFVVNESQRQAEEGDDD